MSRYLVTLPTGQQGAATIDHLLANGAFVNAVLRDTSSIQAKDLARRGVKLFQGNLNDVSSFTDAAQGCDGIFLNLLPMKDDPHLESRQAKAILDIAKAAGVNTVVASTLFFTADQTKWDNDDNEKHDLRWLYLSKFLFEAAVREAGLQYYTILRPAWIHSNYLLPYSNYHQSTLPAKGELEHALDTTMPHIDEDDIGRFAAAALFNPGKFNLEEIELGNENLRAEEVGKIMAKISGKQVRVKRRSEEEVDATRVAGHPTQRFQVFANRSPLIIDGKAVESKYGIKMTSLEEYFERRRDILLQSIGDSQ